MQLIKILVENIWQFAGLIIIIWIIFNPEILNKISKIKFGDLELELRELKNDVASLENELERERSVFMDLLEGFDPKAPVKDLAKTREVLKAHARTMDNPEELKGFLTKDASAEQLFAAAVAMRERRPVGLFSELLDCLDRLAESKNLDGIRLNTVWTLTSALHRMLISSVRDGVKPTVPEAELKRAQEVLDKLYINPRVQHDRSDNPDKGVRGPIRFAKAWIDKGLNPKASG